MKLGTATSVLYLYSIQDAIPLIKRAGYDGVDIWGGRPHVYRQDLSVEELQSLRQAILDQGMSVSSFMPAFYRYPHSLSNPNPKVRQDSIDYMRMCVDNAAALGAEVVLVVPDFSLHGQSRQDSLNRLIESIDTVAQYTAQHPEIMLGIEILYTDETDLVNSAADAQAIIEQLGHSNIGAVLDTGTLNLSKEPIEDIFSLLGEKVLQIHANDNNGEHRQQNLIPGDGTFDFQGLTTFLKGIGYEGFLSAELSKEYADDVEAALTATAKRMRAWIQAS
ncbi:MAG: sugar phosphate isomerase/epimerase [Chloroflexota bacterium]|jgi:protein FrlC